MAVFLADVVAVSARVLRHHDWCFCVAKQVYFVVLSKSDVPVVADFLECLADCRA